MVPNDPEEEEAEPGDQTGALAFDPDLIAAAEGKPRSQERSARLRGKPRPNYSGKTTRGDRAKEAAVEQFCGLVAAVEAGPEKITPQSFNQAIDGPDSDVWAKAMMEQMTKWQKRGIGTLVMREPGMEVVRTRWVFAWKGDGRAKARIAAKGFDQTFGVSYSESFSPTLKMTSLRLFLHLCVEYGLDIFMDDVVAAFISSELGEDEVYLEVPEGFVCPPGYVLRLRAPVEGLKQASAKWTRKIDGIMTTQGFQPVAMGLETCLYYKVEDGIPCFVARYVDDTATGVHPSQHHIYAGLIEALEAEGLELHRLGNLIGQKLRGIRVRAKPGTNHLILDQQDYILATVEKFPEVKTHKPVDVPMDPRLDLFDEGSLMQEPRQCQSLIGALLTWLTCCTAPTLTTAVNRLAQFLVAPTEMHWAAALAVLAYAHQHLDEMELEIGGGGLELRGYADADFAPDRDRKSTSGYVFFIGHTTLSWASRKQKGVVLHSTHVELNALLEGGKEALHLRQLCGFLLILLQRDGFPPTIIHQDNLSCVGLAEKGRLSSLTKHIDIKDLWIKQEIDEMNIVLVPVRTEHMLADVLTKPMDAPTLRYFNPFFTRNVSPVPPDAALMAKAGKLNQGAKKKFKKWRRACKVEDRLPPEQRVTVAVAGIFL